MVVLGLADPLLVAGGPELAGLWAARGAFVAASAAVAAVLRPGLGPAAFGGVLCGWYALTVALHIYVATAMPPGHAEMRMTAAMAVLMSYAIFPVTFRLQTAGALLFTAGSLAVMAWLNPPGDPAAVVGEVCWLSLANALGALVSYRLHSRQRLLFAAHRRQSELADGLGRALAEMRTLRGLIRVCAWCRKVSAQGEWQLLEAYVAEHSHAEFTHGICPVCLDQVTAEGLHPAAG